MYSMKELTHAGTCLAHITPSLPSGVMSRSPARMKPSKEASPALAAWGAAALSASFVTWTLPSAPASLAPKSRSSVHAK